MVERGIGVNACSMRNINTQESEDIISLRARRKAMIERKQLDERTPTITELIVIVLVSLVSLSAFAALF